MVKKNKVTEEESKAEVKEVKSKAKVTEEEAKSEVTEEEAKSEVTKEEAKAEVSKKEAKAEVTKEEAKAEVTKVKAKAEVTEEEAKTEVTNEEAKAKVTKVKTKAEVTEEEAISNPFDNKTLRLGFIRKVYAILSAQLIVTLGLVALFSIPGLDRIISRNTDLTIGLRATSVVLLVGILIALVYWAELVRKTPWNFIMLGIFTLALGFMIGMYSCAWGLEFRGTWVIWEVSLAVGVCAAITGAITLFAFQTTIDFTAVRGCLVAALVCLFIYGMVAAISPAIRSPDLIYASIGCIVFSFFVVIDTQLIIRGEHKYSFSTEDYVFAALVFYMDIINLFLFILKSIWFWFSQAIDKCFPS